jgi:hypothetical protein
MRLQQGAEQARRLAGPLTLRHGKAQWTHREARTVERVPTDGGKSNSSGDRSAVPAKQS